MKTKVIPPLALLLCGCLVGCSSARNGEPMSNGPGPSFDATSSFNGKQLLIGSCLWDVQTGEKIKDFAPRPVSISAATFSPDGRKILLAFYNTLYNTLFTNEAPELWDAATGQGPMRFSEPGGDNGSHVQFSADGRLLLTVSSPGDTNITVWDVKSGRRLSVLPGLRPPSTDPAGCTGFSPDGRRVVVLGWRTITVWDSTSGAKVCVIKQDEDKSPDFFVSTRFSPNGKLLLSEQCDGLTRLWNARTGREVQKFAATNRNQQGWPCALFCPNGRQVISGADKGEAILWDVSTGKEIRKFQTPGTGWSPVEKMILSHDGKRLITVCHGGQGPVLQGVSLWEVQSGRLLRQFDDSSERIVGFSPVNETFITIRDGKPDQLWDGVTGKILSFFANSRR